MLSKTYPLRLCVAIGVCLLMEVVIKNRASTYLQNCNRRGTKKFTNS